MTDMGKQVSVSKCSVRGDKKWRVRWHDTGKVRRKFFNGQEAANTFAAKKRGEEVGVRHLLATIPQAEQEKLVMLFNETRRRNVDLLTLLHAPPAAPVKKTAPAVADVITEMVGAKKNAGISERYLGAMGCILDEFAKGRERMAINEFTRADIEGFMNTKKLAYRSTIRARLSTLFNFAIRREYSDKNPCSGLEAIKHTAKSPVILTLDQTKTLLDWFQNNPRAMGWFILSTFAGLRPEEAQKTSWSEINFQEGRIRVEAQTTKVRERRIVYPLPTAFKWLKVAQENKTLLPINARALRMQRKRFRDVLGFAKWPKDVTRHTAASMWLARDESAVEKVAKALGNSEKVLKKHYMAVSFPDGTEVTRAVAEKFWNL